MPHRDQHVDQVRCGRVADPNERMQATRPAHRDDHYPGESGRPRVTTGAGGCRPPSGSDVSGLGPGWRRGTGDGWHGWWRIVRDVVCVVPEDVAPDPQAPGTGRLLTQRSTDRSARSHGRAGPDHHRLVDVRRRTAPTGGAGHGDQRIPLPARLCRSTPMLSPARGFRSNLHPRMNPCWYPQRTPQWILACRRPGNT